MNIAGKRVLITGANRGPAAQSTAEGWRIGVAKAMERQFAALVSESATNGG